MNKSELDRIKELDSLWEREGIPAMERIARCLVEYQIGKDMEKNFKNGGMGFRVKNGSYCETFETFNKLFPQNNTHKFSDFEGKGEITFK